MVWYFFTVSILVFGEVSSFCSLPEIPHGKVYQTSTILTGQRREVVCDAGYKIIGSNIIKCQMDGTFINDYGDTRLPVCKAVNRGKCNLPVIPHGKVLNPNSESESDSPSWTETQVVCNQGFELKGIPFIVCKDGRWTTAYGSADNFPLCTSSCLKLTSLENVDIEYIGTKATVRCKLGFVSDVTTPAVLNCVDGQWQGRQPKCEAQKPCPAPPEIPFADVHYYKVNQMDGSKVRYHCHSGYSMDDESLAQLTCVHGEWPGKLPTCTITIRCDTPESIPNGHWTRTGGSNPYTYELNTKIQYDCIDGFRLLGESLMWCQEDRTWSHIPPQCIPLSDESVYCDSPHRIRHGECTCAGHTENYCTPFTPGMQWMCRCNDGYALDGAEVLTCTSTGDWNNKLPTCIAVDSQISADDSANQGSHISTLAIVVATACSVLGVLLLVMVAVIFRRHKPRPRLYHPTPAPPPYTLVHNNSVDEHDRVALIAYAEGRQVALPTYEEVTRGNRGITHSTNAIATLTVETGPNGQQYRPLPPVPPMLRGPTPSNHATSSDNRHSTATTSTVHNRDGCSEVFGSLDTVNVSISDASTAGTMETVDSGASNPSLASRRANAGSLGSSNGSLATDDAPLLDSGHDSRIMSTSSEPLPEEDKEE